VFDLFILLQTLEVVIWGRAISMAGPRVSDDRTPAGEPESVAEVPIFPTEKRDVA
jgi:hypothetical protein